MTKVFNVKNFLLLTFFIFVVFPTMCFAVGKRVMPIGLVLAIISFLLLLFNPKNIILNIKKLYKLMSTKLLIYFSIWAIISAVFVSVFLHISLIKMLFSIFLAIVLSLLLPYFLSFILTRRCDTRFLIKFYTIILYVILFFGLIDFVIYYFKISPFDTLYNSIIINARLLKTGAVSPDFNIYKSIGIFPRVQSVFEEPSHFAWFICVNIPIVLSLCLSKYKIFHNKYLNIIIKKTMIPVMYISLIMTQSPINIIFAIIISIFYFLTKIKLNKKFVIKIITILFVSLIIVIFLINRTMNADINNTFFYRIKMVLLYTRSFYDLVHIEASLATRLNYYAIMFNIFEKYPIFGCGWGNLGQYLFLEIPKTSIPLTEEIIIKYANTIKPNDFGYCVSIFFRTIAETGLIGIILLFAFFIKIKQYLKYLKEKSYFLTKDFYFGIEQTILLYIIFSFYDSNLYIEYFWFLFGTIAGLYYICKKSVRG